MIWSWMAVPYLLSLLVLVGPALEIHRALNSYKLSREQALKEELKELRTKIGDTSLSAAEHTATREDYEFRSKLREQVNALQTWPFRTGSLLKYSSVVLGNVALTAKGVFDTLSRVFHS